MNYKKLIEDDLLRILNILKSVDENNWSKVINNFYEKLSNMEDQNDIKILVRDLKKIYGGMGSFNDLILYKGNQLCFEENEELDKLRKKIYQNLIDFISL